MKCKPTTQRNISIVFGSSCLIASQYFCFTTLQVLFETLFFALRNI
jgi:hypothetical protein